MTTPTTIKTLFANDIRRRIEEVIKVDQTDEEIIRDEINEYVVTDAIRAHYTGIFEAYRETPNKPHDGIAIWVSGFFGSGKSSFAKMLGLSIANRSVAGDELADLVDDEDQRAAGLAALHQLSHALGELAGADIGLVLDGLHPRVGHRVGGGLEAVEHAARLGERERDFALFGGTVLFEEPLVLFFKAGELVLLFESNF